MNFYVIEPRDAIKDATGVWLVMKKLQVLLELIFVRSDAYHLDNSNWCQLYPVYTIKQTSSKYIQNTCARRVL